MEHACKQGLLHAHNAYMCFLRVETMQQSHSSLHSHTHAAISRCSNFLSAFHARDRGRRRSPARCAGARSILRRFEGRLGSCHHSGAAGPGPHPGATSNRFVSGARAPPDHPGRFGADLAGPERCRALRGCHGLGGRSRIADLASKARWCSRSSIATRPETKDRKMFQN